MVFVYGLLLNAFPLLADGLACRFWWRRSGFRELLLRWLLAAFTLGVSAGILFLCLDDSFRFNSWFHLLAALFTWGAYGIFLFPGRRRRSILLGGLCWPGLASLGLLWEEVGGRWTGFVPLAWLITAFFLALNLAPVTYYFGWRVDQYITWVGKNPDPRAENR